MKLGDHLLSTRSPRACKVCGFLDKDDFVIPNDVWKTVIPTEYQNKFVCVECFGKFACERQIELFRVGLKTSRDKSNPPAGVGIPNIRRRFL
jgi:hypothetical protein